MARASNGIEGGNVALENFKAMRQVRVNGVIVTWMHDNIALDSPGLNHCIKQTTVRRHILSAMNPCTHVPINEVSHTSQS